MLDKLGCLLSVQCTAWDIVQNYSVLLSNNKSNVQFKWFVELNRLLYYMYIYPLNHVLDGWDSMFNYRVCVFLVHGYPH